MKNTIKILFMVIGTLVGAGFASGKEIYLFFGRYGNWGIVGIGISSILTGVILYKTLKITAKKEVDTYKELLEKIEIRNSRVQTRNEIKLKRGLNLLVNLFLLISFYIMVAGFSAYIKQIIPQIPVYIVSLIFVILCYILFQKSIDGILKVNEFLVPILLGVIFILGVQNLPFLLQKTVNTSISLEINQTAFLFQSILYASYNSILLIPALTSLRRYIATEKQIRRVAITTTICMIVVSICIYGLLLRGSFFIQNIEMPLIEILKQFGSLYPKIYGIIIMLSIFTTAISTGYSLLKNIAKNAKEYQRKLFLICVTAILISGIGFSNLVQILYPLFGLLGLIQMIFLLKCKYKY